MNHHNETGEPYGGHSFDNERSNNGTATLPADRFLTAQTWWIASELTRRHPHLRIGTVRNEQNYRLVIVYDEADAFRIQFDLVGGAMFTVDDQIKSLSWPRMMAAQNSHEIVKLLEKATGLGNPQNTPATTPRALVYRVIASALAAGVNDRYDWYAEETPIDFATELSDQPIFAQFEGARASAAIYLEEALANSTDERPLVFYQPFITLMRDHVPVAVFDVVGVAHTLVGPKPLMDLYRGINDNLTLTMAQVVGPYLP